MQSFRNRVTTKYADGRIEDFNPLICWHVDHGLVEISIRSKWAIGIMWLWRIGTWSRYRTLFVEIFGLTIYIHYGECAPHNPRTGEIY